MRSENSLKEKVQQTIQKYELIKENDKVVVGVSGGPDSISLLNILYELGYNVCVAHLHHGLRENADLDEAYVQQFCEKRNIPFFVKRVQLKEQMQGMTLEEAGRKARYDFFVEVFMQEGASKIATAHNSNDSVETVLMNVIRGSGIGGLKGIMPSQEMRVDEKNSITIIRPLLACTRQEIESYCEEEKLEPRHDESNDETLYTRNKIRLALIPYIEENINPNVVQNVNRLSWIAKEEEAYWNRQVEDAYQRCLMQEEQNKVVCNLKVFNTLDIVIQKRLILKLIIKTLGTAKDIEKVHVDDILKLCQNNVGNKYLMPNPHIKITVKHSKVEYEKIL